MTRTTMFRLATGIAYALWCLTCASEAQVSKKYWVYFSDKGPSVPSSGALSKTSSLYRQALTVVQPRALARRAKALSPNSLVDASDLPLYQGYLEQVKSVGARLQQQSRWLNAASYLLTPDQVATVAQLTCVRKVEPVGIIYGHGAPENLVRPARKFSTTASPAYGQSLEQNLMINSPPLHTMGITGHGVLVGMLDTGFRWRFHESLQTRHVVAECDFIQHDSVTANQDCGVSTQWCDPINQDQHGTLTMSTLGGFMPGQLVGPAFDVDFILAKTEYLPVSDYKWEEDNWAAGIEWMEACGVDVVSSSLAYNTFVDSTSYTWDHGDFNGRTTVCTKAAVRAAELGIVVCDAMANEGNGNGVVGTLLAPADADSIISVGAVDFSRRLASFSSTGPTNDGRTKPDVVAPGVDVYCANTAASNAYFSVGGTSLATPLAAASAALLLSARPELTAMQVRDILRSTADTIDVSTFPTRPNNFTGWGLVNVFNAALSYGPIFGNSPTVETTNTFSAVSINVVSKFGLRPDSVLLHYAVSPDTAFFTIAMSLDSSMFFPTSGRYKVTIPPRSFGAEVTFFIDARDTSHKIYRNPAAVTGKVWKLKYGVTGIETAPEIPAAYSLSQNFPNPFNPSTIIQYSLPKNQHVVLKIYNVLGQEVRTLVDEQQPPGFKAVEFDGSRLPSGVYFYRLTTANYSTTRRMLLLR